MPLSIIFQLYRGSEFYWWRKLEYSENTIDLSQVRQTLSHNVVHLAMNGVRTHTQFEIIKSKSTNKNTDLKSII
jgi:hypothetical protein